MKPGYHAMVAGLATGSLVLSFLALSVLFWIRPGNKRLAALINGFEPVSFYAGLFALITLLLSSVTGLLIWPLDASLNSPTTSNKIFAAAVSTLLWTVFLIARLKAGPDLWSRRDLGAHFAYVCALAGFAAMLVTAGIGGDIAGIPSGFLEVLEAVGFRIRYALYFPTLLNALLVAAGLAALVAGIYSSRQRSSVTVSPAEESGRKS